MEIKLEKEYSAYFVSGFTSVFLNGASTTACQRNGNFT